MSKRDKIGVITGIIVSVLIFVIRLIQRHNTNGIFNSIKFSIVIGALCGLFVIFCIEVSNKEKFIKDFKEGKPNK